MSIKKELKNPLLEREKYNSLIKEKTEDDVKDEIIIKKTIATYGDIKHLTKNLLETVDFNNKEFINRIYDNEKELFDSDFYELKESIKEIGVINMIYLLEKEGGKRIIISGLRRMLAAKELFSEGVDVKATDRVVIFRRDTPYELLDKISVDENTKRKNLKIIELSYKLNVEAKRKNKSVDEMLTDYQISRSHYKRIKKAMSYPDELKNIVEEIGITKAEALNKIIEIEKKEKDVTEIIEKYKEYDRDELTNVLKELKKGKEGKENKEKNFFEMQELKNSTVIKFDKKLSSFQKEVLSKILKMIETEEYSKLNEIIK